MTLTDLAFYVAMAVALVAAFAAQAMLMTAREHVRLRHPAWYEALGAGGSAMRMGGPHDRARRRLIRPLLFGAMPPAVRQDEALARLARGLRLAFGALALGFMAVAAVVAARLHLGAA